MLSAATGERWEWLATGAAREDRSQIEALLASADSQRAEANERFVARELERFGALFDTLERHPLTAAQRRACVIDDDNNLVLAGAGTGKTSVILGRLVYLISSARARAGDILAVAYNRDAAEELRERAAAKLGSEGGNDAKLTIKTFHALGKEIIASVEGRQPSISVLAEDSHRLAVFISAQIEALAREPDYLARLIDLGWFGGGRTRTILDYPTLEAYEKALSLDERRTLTGVLVKSREEVRIANWLTLHGIAYDYEKPFPVDTADRDYRQYRPDFTLRDPDDPERVVYLEHFGISRNGEPPPFFSPEERERYRRSVQWKRELYATLGLPLLETASWQFQDGSVFAHLEARLQEHGVRCQKIDDAEAFSMLRESGLVQDLAVTFSTLVSLARENPLVELPGERLGALQDEVRESVLARWRLFEPVLRRYEDELKAKNEIDFPELILRATRYVAEGRYRSPFLQILVDEFQDISAARAGLVLALRDQRPETRLFCVGDDWQSIYRFSGSDVWYTAEFQQRIGPGTVTALDQTFRFNEMIGTAASRFIARNPAQTRKEIRSRIAADRPAISLVATAEPALGMGAVLRRIDGLAAAGADLVSVFVLARYWHELDSLRDALKRNRIAIPRRLKITYSTVHGAKGLEADFVVLVGLGEGTNGFPASKGADPLVEMFLPEPEDFPFAEERRLFYVALTRARQRVYLVFDRGDCSEFVRELEDGEFPTVSDEFHDSSFLQRARVEPPCPRCATGRLVPREGSRDGTTFHGCNRFPLCRYRERGCPVCSSVLIRVGDFRVCAQDDCDGVLPECPDCHAPMVHRTSQYGSFFGCSNFGRADPLERCVGKRRELALPDADELRARLRRQEVS